MIFFREVDLLMCLITLEISHSSYALHLKLSPNICFSHTANKLITLPKFEPAETVSPSRPSTGLQDYESSEDMGIGSGLLGSSSSAMGSYG